MNTIEVQGNQKAVFRAEIIRANGTRENLGTVIGGNLYQKVESFLRIHLANLKLWLRS